MLSSVILRLVHYVISLGVFVFSLVSLVSKGYDVCRRKFVTGDKLAIGEHARKLDKLPVHVGIVVAENDISFTDIANVVVWAVAFGIHYISVYDINGEIKRKSIVLSQEVEKKQSLCASNDIGKCRIRICSFRDQNSDVQYSDKWSAKVQLLSAEDGHPTIVGTARSLCQQVACGQCRIEDITTSRVDALFQDMFLAPDPDLLLQFGPASSLSGFLPWQCRLTEILSVPSHIGFSCSSFLSILQRFSCTRQRYGK